MVVDLFDELVELWTVPIVLYVGVWLAEVNVKQLSKDQTHRALGRPRHRLQQQRYNGLLYRIRQTHLSLVNRSWLQGFTMCCVPTNKTGMSGVILSVITASTTVYKSTSVQIANNVPYLFGISSV